MMGFFGGNRRERTRIERLENERPLRTTTGEIAAPSIGGVEFVYVPSNLGDWNGGVAPINPAAALDQLAARIAALEGSSSYVSEMMFNLIEG